MAKGTKSLAQRGVRPARVTSRRLCLSASAVAGARWGSPRRWRGRTTATRGRFLRGVPIAAPPRCLSRMQGVGERLLVDDLRRARTDRCIPGLAASTCADEADRRASWSRESSYVGDRDLLLERRRELDPKLARAVVAHEGVVRDEPHAECARCATSTSDALEAHDPGVVLPCSLTPSHSDRFQRPAESAFACGTLRWPARATKRACARRRRRMLDCGALTTITLRRAALGDVDVVEADAGATDDDEVAPGGEHRPSLASKSCGSRGGDLWECG